LPGAPTGTTSTRTVPPDPGNGGATDDDRGEGTVMGAPQPADGAPAVARTPRRGTGERRTPVERRLRLVPLVWSAVFRDTGDAAASDALTSAVLATTGRTNRHAEVGASPAQLVAAAQRAAARWIGDGRRRDLSPSGGPRLAVYECCERLERLLASEAPGVRDAMLLVYVSHRRCGEVAEDLGISAADVGRRIEHGLARLGAAAGETR
jgi:DNA-directed RNA polymerase specialized sigma24 family protein